MNNILCILLLLSSSFHFTFRVIFSKEPTDGKTIFDMLVHLLALYLNYLLIHNYVFFLFVFDIIMSNLLIKYYPQIFAEYEKADPMRNTYPIIGSVLVIINFYI